jgi:hypothetical protein
LDHRRAHPGGEAGAPHVAGESATASLVHPYTSSQTAAESSRRTQALALREPRAVEGKKEVSNLKLVTDKVTQFCKFILGKEKITSTNYNS